MSRRRKHVSHENHERWLVSYADFITLLFAFFVVMFASSRTDQAKAQQMSVAVKDAFEQGHLNSKIAAILGGTRDDAGKGNAQRKGPGGATPVETATRTDPTADLLPSLQRLNADLKKEIEGGEIAVSMEPRGLVISLKQAAFFPSGADALAESSHSSLQKVANVIKKLPNPVRLEGHTDAVPIHNARFRSNWELSAARSIAVLDLFSNDFGVPRGRIAISGYADIAPVASNDTPEGQAQNRRVDILIMNETASMAEPTGAKNHALKR